MFIRNNFFALLALAWLMLPAGKSFAEEVAVAAHVHTDISSGNNSIADISRIAREQGIDAVIVTDLLHERYEYGIRPFQDIFKFTFKRPSIWEIGVPEYLNRIREANQSGKGALIIEGTVVTPFYYWTGSVLPGPLVLNGRAKDMIVFGLEDPEDYRTLPLLGTRTSGFSSYDGNQYAAPYQKVVDDVRKKGGIVFWSHPDAQEHFDFWGGRVLLDSTPARDEVVETSGYTGVGVFSVELAQIMDPAHKGLSAVGGVLDQLLVEYCEGKRQEPAWILGEVDYNAEKPGQYLGSILNMVSVEELTREEILSSMRAGQFYLLIPGPDRRRLQLKDFSVTDGTSKAGMGQTLKSAGPVTIHLELDFSDQAAEDVRFILIRHGKVLKEWDQKVPFQIDVTDPEPLSGMSYYRLIVSSERGDRLLTHPVFVRRSRS